MPRIYFPGIRLGQEKKLKSNILDEFSHFIIKYFKMTYVHFAFMLMPIVKEKNREHLIFFKKNWTFEYILGHQAGKMLVSKKILHSSN